MSTAGLQGEVPGGRSVAARPRRPGAVCPAPELQALEPRLLLSGSGLEAAALAAAGLGMFSPADLVSAPAPAVSTAAAQDDTAPSVSSAPRALGVTPQPQVTALVQTSPYGLVTGGRMIYLGRPQFTVLGTDGDDSITISQTPTTITLTTTQGSTVYSGAFGSVTVYGYGGHDIIRVTYSVTADVTVSVGDAGSTVYDAGWGNDTITGGGGDDTIIAIGGGAKKVTGGAGMDSLWVDGNDTLLGVSAAETAAGNVHVVSQFYGNVSMVLDGQALADPALTALASRYASFASQPLFTDGPTYTDIRQGALADCYFLAPLASMADADPNGIRQAITSLGDGTYAVRFYRSGSPVYLRVDADLPVTSGGALVYARLSASGEMWAPLMEKAYAFFRIGANSYGSLENGAIAPAATDLTGQGTQTLYAGVAEQTMYNFLCTSLANSEVVAAGSRSSASGPIVSSHGYMVLGAFTSGGTMYATVYNPWGYDGSSYDSNPNDGLITLTLTQFLQYFSAGVATV